MTIKKAYKILKRHNAWRRDKGKHNLQDPAEIGKALDTLLALAKKELLKETARKGYVPQNPMNPAS